MPSLTTFETDFSLEIAYFKSWKRASQSIKPQIIHRVLLNKIIKESSSDKDLISGMTSLTQIAAKTVSEYIFLVIILQIQTHYLVALEVKRGSDDDITLVPKDFTRLRL